MKKSSKVIIIVLILLVALYIASTFNNYGDNDSIEYISPDITNVVDSLIYAGQYGIKKDYALNTSKEVVEYANENLSNKLKKVNDYNFDVYTLSKSKNYDKIIIYIHGGAYTKHITGGRLSFCDKLATRTNSKVYIPLYGLAPNYNYRHAYSFLYELYTDLLKEDKPIIIVGDSSGGGLALGFTEYLKESNIKQPKKMVLMSPLVDIKLSNNLSKYFHHYGNKSYYYDIIQKGKLWAAGLDRSNYKVSPINGNLSALPETLLFASDTEIIFPDSMDLYLKMRVNSTVHFIIGHNEPHVFPIYNTPSGIQAQNKIINFINGK